MSIAGDDDRGAGDAPLEFEARLRAVCGHLNVLHAQLVDLVAEAVQTRRVQKHGLASLCHWLSWPTDLSAGHAAIV